MDILNLEKVPMPGTTLIEASAGTGKTYSIANLYLHFILKGIDVSKILVVTFTEAATKELRERLRENLSLALKIARPNNAKEELTIGKILNLPEYYHVDKIGLLERAVLNFDQSAIFTIHGFCQRILKENAFESRAIFDAELMTNQNNIIDEVVNDFWRREIYPLNSEKFNAVSVTRSDLKDLCRKILQEPDLALKGAISLEEYDKIEESNRINRVLYQSQSADILQIINSEKENITSLLSAGQLNGNYKKTAVIEDNFNALIADLERQESSKNGLQFFTADAISKARNAKAKAANLEIAHPLFDLCQKLNSIEIINSAPHFNLYLKTRFSKEAWQNLADIKERLRVNTFDDFILQLETVLNSENSCDYKPLHNRIRDKYQVALVDEFQDTDPKQYSIFNNIFGKSNKHYFYMIGDPKQSIYAFRGADIYSYLEAQKNANGLTLDTNYRSEKAMVNAVNDFFLSKTPKGSKTESEEAFAFAGEIQTNDTKTTKSPGITYKAVKSGADKRTLTFAEQGNKELLAPLQLRWFEDEGDKVISKGEALPFFYESVCQEVVLLLNKSHEKQIGFTAPKGKTINPDEQQVQPGDIAILVNSHQQAQTLKELLLKNDVPSVIQKSGNIFDSEEAKILLRFLNAVVDPNARNVNPLLISSLFTFNAKDLKERKDEESLAFLSELLDYQKNWERRGALRTIQKFMDQHHVSTKALSQSGGERILTNFYQLRELLHKQESEKGFGLAALTRFLNEKIHSSNKDDELHEQRLETDADAVQIMTIHKSKGLEFPIVFIPFMWCKDFKEGGNFGERKSTNDFSFFHTKEQKRYYSIDDKDNARTIYRRQWRREQLGEQLRQLYVALTRAANRCYLYWGQVKSEPSLFSYLADQKITGSDIADPQSEKLPDSALGRDFWRDVLADKKKGHTAFVTFDREVKTDTLLFEKEQSQRGKPPELPRDCSSNWQIGSYSKLAGNHPKITYQSDAEVDKSNESENAVQPAENFAKDRGKATGFFAFPRGANPGTCIHEIFENIDFTNAQNWDAIIEAKLKKFLLFGKSESVQQERLSSCRDMLTEVVNTKLAPNDFCLADIGKSDRLDEMEFYFPVQNINKDQLAQLFHKHYPQGHENAAYAHDLQNLKYKMGEGFMNGSIDLVFRRDNKFYVLDWKTNHMGNDASLYDADSLKKKVRESYYFLQYHIYTLALHQFLEKNLANYSYEEHFGGVIYAFVRGFESHSDKAHGIHRDLIPYQLIKDMQQMIIGDTGECN